MVIDISVQYNGGFPPDIILLCAYVFFPFILTMEKSCICSL